MRGSVENFEINETIKIVFFIFIMIKINQYVMLML